MAHPMPTSAAGLIWLTPPTSSPGLDELTPPTSAPGLDELTPPTSAPGLDELTPPTSALGLTGLTPAHRDRCSLPRAGDGHAPRRCAQEISCLSHANTYTYMLVASEYVYIYARCMQNDAKRRSFQAAACALHRRVALPGIWCVFHATLLQCCTLHVAFYTLHAVQRRPSLPRGRCS
jgi:hypothetical protein